ncbi:Sec-independent protein translocase TatB [Microbacterium hominis]|uniref:Sec-independent protein translocase TatB n=1 Tax=Microbacterium hominis TaxID=162426 RepID=A0A7D4Q0P0_9MICO|nr:Sec-independent protein translocase TatB [Microbacterium hominis]QKJ19118.1 Sec-independent protein translocase TatB [Microbacterium hominis]
MFFGLTIEKLLLIALVAALIIGPERLPRYAEALAMFTRRARDWVTTARTRVKEEMGEDFEDVDWKTLDPRQYDPRRIIREALLDDSPAPAAAAAAAPKPVTPALERPATPAFQAGQVPPFDAEAT